MLDRTDPPGARGRPVTAVDHPGGAGAALPEPAADGSGVPGRLDHRARRADPDLRRGVEPPRRRSGQAAALGVLRADRRGRRPDRVRRLQVADPQARGALAQVDEQLRQDHARSGRRHRAWYWSSSTPRCCSCAPQRVWRSAPKGWAAPGAALGVVYYVAIAASTVALPILAYAVSGDRLRPTAGPAQGLDGGPARHAVAAILVVLGLLVLYKGIHGL